MDEAEEERGEKREIESSARLRPTEKAAGVGWMDFQRESTIIV